MSSLQNINMYGVINVKIITTVDVIDFRLSFKSSFMVYFYFFRRVFQITCLFVVNCSAKKKKLSKGDKDYRQ